MRSSTRNTALFEQLASLLPDRFSTDQSVRHDHGHDESSHPSHPPEAVCFPATTEEVAEEVPSLPDVVVETEWRRLPTEEQATKLPQTLEEIAEYHTIILGDVSPEMLTPQLEALLIEAVR